MSSLFFQQNDTNGTMANISTVRTISLGSFCLTEQISGCAFGAGPSSHCFAKMQPRCSRQWFSGRCPSRLLVRTIVTTLPRTKENLECFAENQRVAVIGAGAVGSYYGARLCEAGHDVQFHVRGSNLQSFRRKGLKVTSIDGDMYIAPEKIQAYASTNEMKKPVDWIVVSLKSTALDAVPHLLEPLLHPGVRIIAIMNGMIEDDLIAMLKEKMEERSNGPLECCRALYGGMAFICCNRLAPAVVDHSFYGPLAAGVASHRNENRRCEEEDKSAFLRLWAPTKVRASFEDSLLRGRWRKNIWNLPFNGISVAMGGITVDKIVTDMGLRSLSEHIMSETVAIGNADLEREYGPEGYDPLDEEDKLFLMSLSDTMGEYRPSTMIDLLQRKPMEVDYLFRKPLDRGKELGISSPYLETIVWQIEAYQKEFGLF